MKKLITFLLLFAAIACKAQQPVIQAPPFVNPKDGMMAYFAGGRQWPIYPPLTVAGANQYWMLTVTSFSPKVIGWVLVTIPVGVTGPAGPQGATGAIGPQGPIGATGPKGADGINGIINVPSGTPDNQIAVTKNGQIVFRPWYFNIYNITVPTTTAGYYVQAAVPADGNYTITTTILPQAAGTISFTIAYTDLNTIPQTVTITPTYTVGTSTFTFYSVQLQGASTVTVTANVTGSPGGYSTININ